MAWRLALIIPIWLAKGVLERVEKAVAGDEMLLNGQPIL